MNESHCDLDIAPGQEAYFQLIHPNHTVNYIQNHVEATKNTSQFVPL